MGTKQAKSATSSKSKRTKNRKPAAATAVASTNGKKTATRRSAAKPKPMLTDEQRANRTAIAAYFLAEQRAFAPNHELDDWLAAERSL